MRRAIVAILGTAAGTSLLVGLKANADPPTRPVTAPRATTRQPPPGAIATATAQAGAATATAPNAAPPVAQPGRPGEGTFDGTTVSTPYGPVAVTVTMAGGKITDVDALLPSHGHSGELSDRAGPRLRQQALARQSAKLDTVSGATYTSDAYRQSLQSALDQARRG